MKAREFWIDYNSQMLPSHIAHHRPYSSRSQIHVREVLSKEPDYKAIAEILMEAIEKHHDSYEMPNPTKSHCVAQCILTCVALAKAKEMVK